jgi:hypothetical protein
MNWPQKTVYNINEYPQAACLLPLVRKRLSGMISQIAIMIFGASAIWFVSRTEKWKRWGYILGLCGQPFWIYTTIQNEQWGILIMTLVYAYSWAQGIWNYWIKNN